MRKILIGILAVSALLSFSCKKAVKSNEFEVATWAAGNELKEFTEIVDKVNAQANGKYTIKVLSIPSDYYIKLSTKIAAKKAPDFFWLTQELIAKYASLGAIVDITGFFNQSLNLKPDDFYEGVIKSARYKGGYWGLPWIANPFIVYYNKTMFEALGIQPPRPDDDWTWDEFIDISRKIAGKTYRGKPVFEGNPNIETFIWSGGGDILAEDGTTVLLDSPGTVKGVGNLVTMFREHLIPRFSEITNPRNVYFEKQEVAMFLGGVQDDFERKIGLMDSADKFELAYAPIPSDPSGKSNPFDWTASTVMSVQTKDKALAYEAMEALTLAFFEWKIPPIKGSIDTIVKINPDKKAALQTIGHALVNARSANYTDKWTDISDTYLWRGLYLAILQNPDADYEDLIKKAAEGIRSKVSR